MIESEAVLDIITITEHVLLITYGQNVAEGSEEEINSDVGRSWRI